VGTYPDEAGVVCASIEKARAEAWRAVSEMALDQPPSREMSLSIKVFDEQKVEALEVKLSIMEISAPR
jgi:hypothetical protein